MLDPHAIDPGGPIDPAVPGPQPVDEMSRPAAFTLMAPGWYPPEHAITQAYGFCFTDHGLVALVQTDDGFCNLPGGRLEPGETARDALVREVAEEACDVARAAGMHGSPTVLVDGIDPFAPAGLPGLLFCRVDGAPNVDARVEPRRSTTAPERPGPVRVAATEGSQHEGGWISGPGTGP